MNLPFTGLIYDILFIIILIACIVIGYSGGFVQQFYDFIAFILSIFLGRYFGAKLGILYNIVNVGSYVDPFVNPFRWRIIMTVIMFILLLLFGVKLKPKFFELCKKSQFIKSHDPALGSLFCFLEGFCIIYLCCIFMIIPFFHNGEDIQSSSFIARLSTNVIMKSNSTNAKLYFEYKENMINDIEYGNEIDFDDVYEDMMTVYNEGNVKNRTVRRVVKNYFDELSCRTNVSESQYNKIISFMTEIGFSEKDIDKMEWKLTIVGD